MQYMNAACLSSQHSIDQTYSLINDGNMGLNHLQNNLTDKPIRRRRRRRRRAANITFPNYNSSKNNNDTDGCIGGSERVKSSGSMNSMHRIPLQAESPSPPIPQLLTNQALNEKLLKINSTSIDYDKSSYIAQQHHSLLYQSQQQQQAHLLNIPISNRSSSLTNNRNSDDSCSSNYESDSETDSEKGIDTLTSEDEKLLASIDKAYSTAILNVTFENSSQIMSPPDVDATINVSEIPVRRLVNFFKFNSDFLSLSQDTQTIVLKGCMMELLLIHAGITYDPQSNSFHEPSKSNPCHLAFSSLRNTYKEEKYQRIMSIAKKFFELCEGNFLIIKIMFFLSLFKLDNDGISPSESEKLRSLNIKYTNFLHKYMQKCFPYPTSDLKFGEFACLMREVNSLSIEFRKIVVENSNPVNISGLMKEVFSLHENSSTVSNLNANAIILQHQQQQRQRQLRLEQEENNMVRQQNEKRLSEYDGSDTDEKKTMEKLKFTSFSSKSKKPSSNQ